MNHMDVPATFMTDSPEMRRYVGVNRFAVSAFLDGSAAMVLKPGMLVAGNVFDRKGQPIPNALIRQNRSSAELDFTTHTAHDGRFSFHNVKADNVMLAIEADGFAPQEISLNVTGDLPHLRVDLDSEALLRGTVVDQSGAPITNATVAFATGERARVPFQKRIRTDDTGRFEWSSAPTVPPGIHGYSARV